MQVALSGIILLISGLAVQKSNLTNTVKDGISGDANGIYELKVRALDLVYAGCMAQHGYLQQKPQ
jgi:hypothetical protein